MAMDRLVSVIVPVFRVEKYMDRCIRSIVNQTYQNLEIILVEDGSDDGCPQICDRWAETDYRIRVIHKQNEGLVAARKTGLAAASADFIGYVDPDDWIELDFYEHLMHKVQEYDCDIVCMGRVEEHEDETKICENNIAEGLYTGEMLRIGLIGRMLCDSNGTLFNLYPNVWNKVFRKEILWPAQMAVPEMITVGEDVACTYPAILRAGSVYVSGACKYHYNRNRKDSMITSRDDQFFMRLHALHDHLENIFAQSGYAEELRVPLKKFIYGEAVKGIYYEFGLREHRFVKKKAPVRSQEKSPDKKTEVRM